MLPGAGYKDCEAHLETIDECVSLKWLRLRSRFLRKDTVAVNELYLG